MVDSGTFIPYEKSFIELLFSLRLHRDIHSRPDVSDLKKLFAYYRLIFTIKPFYIH